MKTLTQGQRAYAYDNLVQRLEGLVGSAQGGKVNVSALKRALNHALAVAQKVPAKV